MYRLPQFALIEQYFSASVGVEVLRARYDDLIKAVDAGDPAAADVWLDYARKIGVSEPDLAHFFAHWLGVEASPQGRSSSAYFPALDPSTTRDALVGGFIEATRAARAFDLPLSLVLVLNDAEDAVSVRHVVTVAAVVVLVFAPIADEIIRAK